MKKIKLEICSLDAPEKMNWWEANEWCNSLGRGWRLPTLEELDYLYKDKKNDNFRNDGYWSLSEPNSYDSWYKNFSNGYEGINDKANRKRVRAVHN